MALDKHDKVQYLYEYSVRQEWKMKTMDRRQLFWALISDPLNGAYRRH